MILRRLREEGRSLVTPELASGQLTMHDERAWEPFVEEFDRKLALDDFDEQLDRLKTICQPYDPTLDVAAAPAVHRALRLTRREAADPAIWRFLAVIHRPDFVRHRWANTSWATMRTRFWAIGTRPDANAFYRLWWIAELTRDADSYDLTERLLERGPLATKLFVRTLSFYRPTLEAAADALAGSPPEEIDGALVRLGASLGIVPLESLSRQKLRQLLGRGR